MLIVNYTILGRGAACCSRYSGEIIWGFVMPVGAFLERPLYVKLNLTQRQNLKYRNGLYPESTR